MRLDRSVHIACVVALAVAAGFSSPACAQTIDVEELIVRLDDPDPAISAAALRTITSEPVWSFCLDHVFEHLFGGAKGHRDALIERCLDHDAARLIRDLVDRALTVPAAQREVFDVLVRHAVPPRLDLVVETWPLLGSKDSLTCGLIRRWVAPSVPSARRDETSMHDIRRELFSQDGFREAAWDSLDKEARRLGPLKWESWWLARKPVEQAAWLRAGLQAEALTVGQREAVLSRFLRYGEGDVRLAALEVLMPLATARSQHLIAGALSWTRGSTRVRVCLALSRLDHERGVEEIMRLLLEDEPGRLAAIQILVDDGGDAALSAAEVVLETGDAEAVWPVVNAHLLRKRPMSLDRVKQLVAHPNLIPERICSYMGWMDEAIGPSALETIRECYVEGRVAQRGLFLRFLAERLGGDFTVVGKEDLFHEDDRRREAAVVALCFKKLAPTPETVMPLLGDPSFVVRVHVAHAFGRTRDPIARGALIVLSKDKEWMVREAATRNLRRQDLTSTIPAFRARLSDEAIEVRVQAHLGLMLAGPLDQAEELFKLVDHPAVSGTLRRTLLLWFGMDHGDAEGWVDWWTREGKLRWSDR